MLRASNRPDEYATAAHRAKLAYVYVRQSSVNQVRQHQESTELQYRLVDRAVGLGWPRERVHVIDEDLGKSGREHRRTARLPAADCRDRARQCRPGAQPGCLAAGAQQPRLASATRTVLAVRGDLADGERLYDPGAYHDRLLLGLSGIMSEAELHQIRMRLHQGERQKAARGELRLPVPGRTRL